MMPPALHTDGLGKRYGRSWALRECTLTIPTGSVTALVGPNGAGKSTLLQLSVGLTSATQGDVRILGMSPILRSAEVLPLVGFLAQDRPLYRRFTVSDTLEMGRRLNPAWDGAFAKSRLQMLDVPFDRKVSKLSGGQQSQVALVLALAKRPRLLLLDEPMSALDPLARQEFMQTLMGAVAEDGLTVLLSSHIIGDMERVCDHLVILSAGRVHLSGNIQRILSGHKVLIGPRDDGDALRHVHDVVESNHTGRQSCHLVRVDGALMDSSWEAHDARLEELVLAYLRRPTDGMASPIDYSHAEVIA
jgi:ABC-2 type transport system ATP-binding protein